MVHTIQEHTMAEINLRRAELTWQTRAICSFLASTVEDNNAREKLFSHAQQLTLLENELDDTSVSGGERSLEDIIENGSVQQALERNNKRVGLGLGNVVGAMVSGRRLA